MISYKQLSIVITVTFPFNASVEDTSTTYQLLTDNVGTHTCTLTHTHTHTHKATVCILLDRVNIQVSTMYISHKWVWYFTRMLYSDVSQ